MEIQVTIVGNLTGDPELRFTPAGVAVCRINIAHNPRVKVDGEWKDGEPTFVTGTAWRTLAENLAESLAKGARVIASGRLTTGRWEKDGVKRERLELAIDAIGPDLAYATASVRKMTRTGGPTDGEWSNSSRQPANPAPGSSLAPGPRSFDDEPPF